MQFAALEARAQSLQDELTAAYKEKAALAEQSLQATRQLQVRDCAMQVTLILCRWICSVCSYP